MFSFFMNSTWSNKTALNQRIVYVPICYGRRYFASNLTIVLLLDCNKSFIGDQTQKHVAICFSIKQLLRITGVFGMFSNNKTIPTRIVFI